MKLKSLIDGYFGDKLEFGEKLRLPWYFDKWYEKIFILAGMLTLSFIVARFIFRLLYSLL